MTGNESKRVRKRTRTRDPSRPEQSSRPRGRDDGNGQGTAQADGHGRGGSRDGQRRGGHAKADHGKGRPDQGGQRNRGPGGGQGRGGGGKRRRNRPSQRRGQGQRPKQPKDGRPFWGDESRLPSARTDVRITNDPDAVPRSLGPPPLPGHEQIAAHYFGVVYDRAVMTASALAAAGGLIDPDALGVEDDG